MADEEFDILDDFGANAGEEDLSEEISTEELSEQEDLFHKNTVSFRCLTQIEISRSSILRDPLYHFPEIEDPHLDAALWGDELIPVYDDIGCEKYRDLCKQENIIPFRRVLNSLPGEVLNLKYYALSIKAMKTICGALQDNNYVTHVSFQENWLKPESVEYITNVLKINTSITHLDLKQCQIGKAGAAKLWPGLIENKTLLELDLSHNDLWDEGLEILVSGLRANTSIKTLNLSHNNLGERGLLAFGSVLEDNYMIHELDLSWNYFYTLPGIQALMESLAENVSVTSLNLAWNGLGEKDAVRPISAYLKTEGARLQHLDLSNNRLSTTVALMLKTGIKASENLISVNLAYNQFKAEDVALISNAFLDRRKTPSQLNSVDFGCTWVNKGFIQARNRIRNKGCTVKYGGVYSNYVIHGPNIKELLLQRAKVVAMKPKRKKLRKDIGHFMIQLGDDPIPREDFESMIKLQKIKLDVDLIEIICTTWLNPKKKIDIKDMKEQYLKLYPDTQLPPKKKGKGKGKKKPDPKKK